MREPTADPACLRARVHGMVQGVGFRYSTVHTVQRLGSITGYVKNTPDGCVEVVAEGALGDLKKLEGWLRKGPPGAYVRRLEARYVPYGGYYRAFNVEF